MTVTRRDLLKQGSCALLGSGLVGLRNKYVDEQSPSGLSTLGASCGMKVGIQASTGRFMQSVLGVFLKGNFDMITPPLKWQSLRPSPDGYTFEEADTNFAYASSNRLAVHGHNLCWNASNPKWLETALHKGNARDYLVDYIKTVAGRYKGKVDSWDVVNEPIGLWDKRSDGLREGPWINYLGPEYIDIAFQTARDVDPTSLRTLNLNGCETQSSDGDKVRSASLVLIKALLKRGVPIQAAALESHIDGLWKPHYIPHADFIRALRDLGLVVYVSEFDVNDSTIPGSISQVKKVVSQSYANYLTEVLEAGALQRLIFWSYTDLGNWYDAIASTSTDPRWHVPAGRQHYPGLTDASYNVNPAYTAVRDTLAKYCTNR
ncbi:MAG TPA: endo-1,4-beta-xylanase [Ktedonobacteraceae bacterium]|nr:endo-1,4-beta-xylanase [Ktedonobacteraceae bacterium]